MPYSYPVSPAPTTGQGPFGRVPGQVTLPQPARDLGGQLPNLGRLNSNLSGDIMAGLEGQLSPGTVNQLQDYNAAWGIGSGMPGSGLAINRGARNLGLFAENLKNQAIGQYNQTVPTISRTQTVDPALQFQIADRNALYGAAPDPTAAASHAQDLYNRYLQSLAGGGRVAGPGGGTRPTGNPSAGPAAQDSMGESVVYGPGGGLGMSGAPNMQDDLTGADFDYLFGTGDVGLSPDEASYFN